MTSHLPHRDRVTRDEPDQATPSVASGLGIMGKRGIQVKLHEPHQAGAALSPADERPEFLVRGAGPALADQLADIGPADTTEDAIQHGREWLTVGEDMAPH